MGRDNGACVSPTEISLTLDYYLHAECICCGQPVAGATLVPITKISTDDVKSQRPSFGRLRLPTFGDRRPTASDLLQTTPSLERPASPSEPLHLTVLISMPTPHAGKAGQDNKNNNGPSAVAVELGIAQVAYTPNVT